MVSDLRKHYDKLVSRIVKDFRHKELLPLKLLFFVHASTLFVLYPYLTIHMRELGINVEETAIMSAVTPIVAIIMPPLAGMVADKIGNFKILLSLFSTIGGLASLLLLLVPVGRITVTYPGEVLFLVGCGDLNTSEVAHASLQLRLAKDLPCNMTAQFSQPGAVLNSKLETCGLMCESTVATKEVPEAFRTRSSEEDDFELSVDSILKARSYAIRVTHLSSKRTTVQRYNLTQEDVSHKQTKQEALSERFMKNNRNFQTAIRRFSKNHYFLPTGDIYGLACSPADEDPSDSSDFLLSSGSRFSRMRRDTSLLQYNCRFYKGAEEANLDVTITDGTPLASTMEKTINGGSLKVNSLRVNSTTIEPSCQKEDSETTTATVYLHNPDNNMEVMHEITLDKCQPRCLLTSLRSDVCSNLNKHISYNPSLTFWVYLVIRVFIGIIGGTAFAMFEGAVIAVLREQKGDYGLQRIYATIGAMISSPLSGILIDWASEGKGYTDFRPAFYLYAALKLLSGILMLLINLEFKSASEHIVTDVMTVLKNIEVIALLVACFILGTSWGYIESFLFWLVQDLGGTRSLMGITITVGGIAGIPLLAFSGPIIHKLGHANVIFIGFIFYAIRLLGYSLIYNPWHCLFFEAMESITSALAITAAVTYAAKLSTPTTDSSIQGLLGGLYFGVGKGAGSLVGGYLMKAFGTRTTFQIFSVFTAFMGCIYFFFNKFYLEKLPQTEGNEICKKKPKKEKGLILPVIKEKPKEAIKSNGEGFANNNGETVPETAEKNVNKSQEKPTDRPVENNGKDTDQSDENPVDQIFENSRIDADPSQENPAGQTVENSGNKKSEHSHKTTADNCHDNPAFTPDEPNKTDEQNSSHKVETPKENKGT